MRIGSGLFLSGIITLIQFSELPPLPVVIAITACIVLLSVRFRTMRLCIWYCAGFLWACYYAGSVLQQELAAELEGRTLTVRGQVVSLPEISDRYIQFDFHIDEFVDPEGQARIGPGRIRLNWYRPYPDVRAGQWLDLEVRLKQAHGYRNPHGFDYEAWLFQQHIRATGYVRRQLVAGTKTTEAPFSIHVFRHRLRDRIAQVTGRDDSGALVLALTIGDQSAIHRDQWQVLTATGTGHLLSISGLHISLLAVFGYFIARWTWPLSYAASCRFPAPKVASLSALLTAMFYALMAGLTIPVQRSLIMVAAFALPGVTGKQISTADSYAWALLAVLILDPMAVLSTGFWLSFGSVLILLLIPVAIYRKERSLLLRWLGMQLYIFIGLLLIMAIWFNQVSVSGLFANIISIPWVSFITIPLILAGVILLPVFESAGARLLDTGRFTLDLLWPLLEQLAGISELLLTIPAPGFTAVMAALTGTALLLLPAGMPARNMGLFLFLPLFLVRPPVSQPGDFEARVLDVGQGLAVIVRTGERTLLYDTGPGFPGGFNTGWAVIVPYLKGEGIRRLDRIIISHADNDHAGGLVDVLKNIRTDRVFSSVPDGIDHSYVDACTAGQAWQWNGVRFDILSPASGSGLQGNNASCVLRVDNGRHSLLLPGDIEKQAERELLMRNDVLLQSTVLIAPHHGSMTSSSPGFVRAVSPDFVIFSTGHLNRFRLPKQDIINRYENIGAQGLNTADSGAIRIQSSGPDMIVTSERETYSRFWSFSPRQEGQ